MSKLTNILNEANQQIVWAWVDTQGLEKTGNTRHIDKYNQGPEYKSAPLAHCAMWLRSGQPGDVERSLARFKHDQEVSSEKYLVCGVFCYSQGMNAMALAKEDIMRLYKQGKKGLLPVQQGK